MKTKSPLRLEGDQRLLAIYHIGYEGVAIDRQGVTDVFTSSKVKEAIRSKGIQLISYKDLAQSSK